MKFYGVQMQGKFVNQVLADVPATFDPSTDTGRLIYNTTDGFLWWGDGETGLWRSIAEGGADAAEAEDMYSDLLRSSIFKNCTWNDFVHNMIDDSLIDESSSTSSLSNNWSADLTAYVFTTVGETLVSNDLYDSHTGLTDIQYCMPSVYWSDAHPHILTPTIQVNNGNGWENATNNAVHRFASSGSSLKIRVIGQGAGTLFSWGVLYNKDLSSSCSHYALTQNTWEIADDITTQLEYQYVPGYILVYLNGILLQDSVNYTATDGEFIDFITPPLSTGDVVHALTFGTSTFGDTSTTGLYIRKDASVSWDGSVTQSLNGSKFTDIGNATSSGEAVTYDQFEQSDNIIIYPGGTFMAWGVYDNTGAASGYPAGVVGTIDPKIYGSNGAVVGSRTLAISNVQLTHKGDGTATATGLGNYLQLKAEYTEGGTTFNWAAFREDSIAPSGVETSIRFSWFVTGQVS